MSRPRIPKRSWAPMSPRWPAKNQPGLVAADIELCVAASTTSLNGRSHSDAVAVARDDRDVGAKLVLLRPATGAHDRSDPEPEQRDDPDRDQRDPLRVAAQPGPRLGPLRAAARGRLVEAQQLADRVVEPVGPERDDDHLDRRPRLDDHEQAHRGEPERAQELQRARLGPGEDAAPEPLGVVGDLGRLEVGRGGRGDRDPDAADDQAPRAQVDHERVPHGRRGAAVGLAVEVPDHQRLADEVGDHAGGAGRREAGAEVHGSAAPVVGDDERGEEARERQQREQDPEEAHVVGDGERLRREGAVGDLDQPGLDVRGDFLATPGATALVADMTTVPVSARSRTSEPLSRSNRARWTCTAALAEDGPERRGAEHRRDGRLEQRLGLDELRGALATNPVARALARRARSAAVRRRRQRARTSIRAFKIGCGRPDL